MFKSKSFRLGVALFVIFSVAAITLASSWAPGFWAGGDNDVSTQIVGAEPLTLGTCDLGNLLDVEATNSGSNAGYATLGAAFAAINAGTHTGSVTIEVCGNTDEVAASAVLNASGSGTASYTDIAIRPVGGAARTITGATVAGSPLIDLNGADNVTINGLNTGGNSLTVANTTASTTSATSTIRFIGGATNNTITNANIQGSVSNSVATNGAVIFFSTDALTTAGNDNNTISNNNIGPAGANLPSKAILCNGSTSTTAIGNSGNTVTNNNIFDYFAAAVTSSGVAANGGCNAWSITNNRFYQTGTRTWTTGATHRAIDINNTTATSGAQGFTITGNIVGYASDTQTGVYTLTGSTGKFQGIQFNGITGGTVSNINNNTVSAVSLSGVTSSGTGTAAPMLGIFVTNGVANTNSNAVGSQGTNGSLVLSTTTTTATDVMGIFNFSVDNWTANSNAIGGISATNLGASGTFVVYGMRANTGTANQFNALSNTVGGSVADSIQLSSPGAASQVVGFLTSNAIANWTSNTVRNLTNSNGTGTAITASVIGMSLTTTTPNQTVSQNTIFNLNNTNTTAATTVSGIQFTGGTANVVERNFIYGLTSATNNTAAEINGIRVAGGTTIYRNNMIAVGAGVANAIGTGSTTGGVNGINEPLGTDSFFHNTVYVGGAPTAGVGPSYAFNSSQTVNVRSFRDNIFFNARSNGGATGKNYAVRAGGATPNPTGLTINNNIYFANGSGAVFGFFNALDVADLSAWRTAVGQDSSSFSLNPVLSNPTAAIPDLHLHPTNPTPAEANGGDVGVVNDFDGQTRAGLTPIDIGADAGNFNGVDLVGPAISYTALLNTASTTNRTLSVALFDVGGVATGGNSPRIYFNKNAGAYTSTTCSITGGTVNSGVWACVIDSAAIGGLFPGDVIRYFVTAQDNAGNVTANPSAGFSATSVNSITTPPTTPNQYAIVAPISGTFNVGTTETVTSLTNVGGIFEQINNAEVTGNVTINITSDLVAETGAVGLNTFASPFTIKINPTGAARVISGSFNGALVRMNGASRVTIDGSIGGVGTDRSLTITNSSVTTPSVVLFGSVGTTPITNGTLKNCIVINGATTSSAVVISDAAVLGNAGLFSNITIQNNDVQRAFVGIFATGGTNPQGGSNLTYTQNKVDTVGANAIRNVGLYMQGVNGATVSNNAVGNFSAAEGENDTGIWLATGTGNATVSGNTVTNLGMTLTTAFAPFGIRESSGFTASANVISGNTVSNLTTTGGTGIRGITVGSGGVSVLRNNVSGIINNNTGTFGAFGIDQVAGNDGVISNNFVSDVNHNMTGGAAFSPDFGVIGIRLGAGTGHRVYNNSVNLFGPHTGTATTALLSAALSISTTAQTGIDVRNNILANNITGGTTSIAHVSAYLPAAGTSAMNLTWNNNSYYFGTDALRQGIGQSGTTAGTGFFPTLGALAAYTSSLNTAATNDNASISSTGVVPFLTATNLHISTSAAEVGAGATIASVTDDFDGDLRFAPYEIGADEFPDTTNPDTTILTSPTNPSNSSTATFTFSGTDSAIATVAGFQCQIDSGAFTTCTSPTTYTGLTQGSHTFNVRTVDGAGNVDPTPATFTWVVDAIAPDTTINTFPTNPSSSSSATFTFSGTDSAVATVASFECSLDSAAFTACISPITYTGLSQGSHNFQVRTIDGAGTPDPSPATYTWLVDAISPETNLLTFPANPSNSASATFTFTGTDSVIAGSPVFFDCSLDGSAFAACSSPQTYTGLADGSHTFQVRARDGVGNVDPTPASYTWVIDTAAPDTTITANPTNPSASTNASFSFTATEVGSTFQCQIDGGGFTTCTSPQNYAGLSSGSHTFQVRATDSSGNTDGTPASFTWVIDATTPDTTITGNPTNPTTSTSATFTFTGTDPVAPLVIAGFECKLDAAAFAACTSPQNYTGLALGSHTFQVRAIDTAGNVDPSPASYTWTINGAGLGGVIPVGTGETYTSLTNTGGIFEAINTLGVTSNITINITTNLVGETGTVRLNEFASPFTVTIKPSGAARTITGSAPITPAGGMIGFNSADRVTIDGSLSTGTDRSLTIQPSNTGNTGGGIYFGSGANGAQNNTIKNVIVAGNGSTTGLLLGVAFGSSTTFGGVGLDNDNNQIVNNEIRGAFYGIASLGASIANKDTGLVVSGNSFPATGTAGIGRVGIYVIFADGAQITQNNVASVSNPGSVDTIGIAVGSQAISTTPLATGSVTNTTVSRNYVGVVSNNATFSSAGIVVNSDTGGTNTIANNMVTGVIGNSNAGDIVAGIYVSPVAGATQNVYFNSVSMSGDRLPVTTNMLPSYALVIARDQPVNVVNNALVNTQTRTGSTGGGGESYAIGFDGPAANVSLLSNYNDLFVSGPLGVVGITGDLTTAAQTTTAGTGTNQATLAAWQTATTEDLNSQSVDPLFVSPTNLHLQATSPILDDGTPIASVIVDFDGDTRSLTTPDIGADELPVVAAPGTLALSSATYTVSEATATATITVNRTVGTDGAVGATYTLTDGTATGGAACGTGIDFVNTGGTVAFLNGESTKTFAVTLCPDSLNKVDETFNVALSAPTGGAIIGSPASAVVTITNDDPLPSFSINDVSLVEGNAGLTSFTFTITRTGGTTVPTTVDIQTADGTAVSSSDYQSSNATVSFLPGDSTKSVLIQVNGDTTFEPDETFFVNLQNPSGATIGDGQGLGTILNDDTAAAGSFTVNDVRKTELNSGSSNAVFTVTYSAGAAATVQYATANRTATVGTDYTLTTGTLTFPASGSAQTQSVSVPVIGDLVKEANETFFLNLTTPTGGSTIGDAQGVGIIIDEDRPYVSDFDRDLFADYSVFRPSEGKWYTLQSSNGVPSIVTFGASTDRPVPADYDGDGKTDIAYYRPSTSAWSILNSSNSTIANYTVGVAGDKPVQGDYNGDGRADLATFRPSTGVWTIFFTNDGGSASQAFGISTDRLVQADYDGDAKTDLAVYRDGIWYILQSSTGSVRIESWGVSTDKPVIGDFNGDGQNDLTIYRNGQWWTVNSLTGAFSVTSWGLSTDIPVPADYDLDGSSDVAVYRPADGDWYILRSSNSTITGVRWGTNGDIPVPSAYIPQ